MSYVSLYRKYRPRTFAEIVGQDHVTRTLINAIAEDRLHHAYLFTGPRGTGKTSTARILAKSINCESGPTPTPCNTCAQCTAITSGSSVDVIELDMASHGGVDDARDLRERALFAPATSRKKVYILDEVHMASTAAFNALLKLVEEPPEHIVFAMATTDPQKVLPTIMSRVQRLDLRRVGAAELAAHVQKIVASEGSAIDGAATDAVVRAGDGSVRDTLSVLEQVLAYADGEVTGEQVSRVLGHTPFERTAGIVDGLAASDLGDVLIQLQGLIDDGHDLRRFAFDLLQHLRDLLVTQVAPDRADLVDGTDEQRALLAGQAARVDRALLVAATDELATAVVEMRQGPPRLPIELAFAKLTVGRDSATTPAPAPAPAPTPTPAPATGTVDAAESATPPEEPPAPPEEPAEPSDDAPSEPEPASRTPLEERAAARAERAAAEGPREPTTTRPPGPEVDYSAPPPADTDADLQAVVEHWPAILEAVRASSKKAHAIYLPATPVRIRNRILTLEYGPRYQGFHATNAMRGDCTEALTTAITEATSQQLTIDVAVEGDGPRRPSPPPASEVIAEREPTAAERAAARAAAATEASTNAPRAVGGQDSAAPPPPDPEAKEAAVREAEAHSTEPEVPDAEALEAAAARISSELGGTPLTDDDL